METLTTENGEQQSSAIVSIVTLDNIANGAVAAGFAEEFQNVIENIVDERSSAIAKREIHIKITLIPDESREFFVVTADVSAKLARLTKPSRTSMTISNSRAGVIVRERPYQSGMFDE